MLPTALLRLLVATAAVSYLPCIATADDQIFDDFSVGLAAPHWRVHSNQVLFQLDDTGGDVHISKPSGGSGGLDGMWVEFVHPILGDFDLSVSFAEASIDRISGAPGNQVQLNLRIGSQLFVVVRSDELGFGHNAHVWVDPPGQWEGPISTNATAGTLRVTRVGSLVSGFFDGTLLFAANYDTGRVSGISFLLQNNGTTDAVSVRFDDFALTADEIKTDIFADSFED